MVSDIPAGDGKSLNFFYSVYSYSYVKKMANAGRVFWFLLVTMGFVLRESRQDRTTMSEGAGWEMGGGGEEGLALNKAFPNGQVCGQ